VTIANTGGTLSTATAGTGNFRAGVNAGNSIASGGNYNTVVGDEAGTANTTGIGNVAIGYVALGANTTANYNTAVGYAALDANTTGSNVAIGAAALGANSAFGFAALGANTTASNNSAFGYLLLMPTPLESANVAIGFCGSWCQYYCIYKQRLAFSS
jgi:trimeric autotransporter adhesin